ncbi:MAG: M28 family peptidase [Acidimicrobiales bacterium]
MRLASWLAEVVQAAAADPSLAPERLRSDVERLSLPRGAVHAPEGLHTVVRRVSASLAEGAVTVEVDGFAGERGWGPGGRGRCSFARYRDLSGANVVATLRGGPAPARSAVVVLAHLDAVAGSPGADDNASGLAVLLALGRLLSGGHPGAFLIDRLCPGTDLVLAATDMEEIGCFGSRRLARRLRSRYNVLTAVNIDSAAYIDHERGSQLLPPMTGIVYPGQFRRIRGTGSRGDFTAVIHDARAAALAACFASCLGLVSGEDAAVGFPVPRAVTLLGRAAMPIPLIGNLARSDHAPFWSIGVPAMHLTDTANFRDPEYHRPGDTPGRLDYQRLAHITAALAGTFAAVASLGTSRRL